MHTKGSISYERKNLSTSMFTIHFPPLLFCLSFSFRQFHNKSNRGCSRLHNLSKKKAWALAAIPYFLESRIDIASPKWKFCNEVE
jgi:hypothetical protein